VIEVRTISDDEIPEYVVAVSTGFHRHAAEGDVDLRRAPMDVARTYGAFDGTTMVVPSKAP
jgi:hypothetical protein